MIDGREAFFISHAVPHLWPGAENWRLSEIVLWDKQVLSNADSHFVSTLNLFKRSEKCWRSKEKLTNGCFEGNGNMTSAFPYKRIAWLLTMLTTWLWVSNEQNQNNLKTPFRYCIYNIVRLNLWFFSQTGLHLFWNLKPGVLKLTLTLGSREFNISGKHRVFLQQLIYKHFKVF